MTDTIFLTGYSDDNLQTSKQQGFLGWKQNSKKKELSNGDFIFVYNIDNKKIDCLFQINSRIETHDLLWKDEVESKTIKYKNRWKANLIKDDLNINITEILSVHPFNTDPNRFYLFIKNPFPNFLNDKYTEFRSSLLTKINLPNSITSNEKIEYNNSQINPIQYFLVQVNKPGSEDILNNKYEHYNWEKTPHDFYHGQVKEGDKLLVYFARKSINYKMQLKKIYIVKKVSEKNEYFDLIEEMELNGLSLNDIRIGIKSGKLRKEIFEKLSQQGFNITKIDKSDYDSVILLDKEPSLWFIRAGERGEGTQTALENNCISIGYGGLSGLNLIKDSERFKEHYKKTHPNDNNNRVGKVVPQIWNFIYTININDFVVLPLPKKTHLAAVGKIVGDYDYGDLNSEIKQFRPIHWFKKDVNINEFDPEIQQIFVKRGTVRHIGKLDTVNKLKDMLKRIGVNEFDLEDINYINNKPIPGTYNNNSNYNIENKWLSLKDSDIKEIIGNVLTAENKILVIDENIVNRIISHLIISKHVILVGAPGTGKTDLARRLLRELGNKILGNQEPEVAVASYEWGRYEVIGGRSITSKENENSFHFGCVINAIKEKRLLLIDEFNRADMNKAFGEMFLALDHGIIQLREDEDIDEKDIPGFDKYRKIIEIPTDFRMICTMNDYDRSLLNELSYGLLRRFAFVEIHIPNDKIKVKNALIERTYKKLGGLTSNFKDEKIDQYTDKFIDFMFALKPKREIGLSSYIDVISFLIYSTTVMKNEPGLALNDAMIDYILPQFDRLDIEILRLAYENASNTFQDENGETIESINPFLLKLNERIQRLEELDKLFKI